MDNIKKRLEKTGKKRKKEELATRKRSTSPGKKTAKTTLHSPSELAEYCL